MGYSFVRCPRCGKINDFISGRDKHSEGDPRRICHRCGKMYVDINCVEQALKPCSPFTMWDLVYLAVWGGLFAWGISLAVIGGIAYVGFGYETPMYPYTLFGVGVALFVFFWAKDSTNELSLKVWNDWVRSDRRLSNPEHAKLLKRAGFAVPERYLSGQEEALYNKLLRMIETGMSEEIEEEVSYQMQCCHPSNFEGSIPEAKEYLNAIKELYQDNAPDAQKLRKKDTVLEKYRQINRCLEEMAEEKNKQLKADIEQPSVGWLPLMKVLFITITVIALVVFLALDGPARLIMKRNTLTARQEISVSEYGKPEMRDTYEYSVTYRDADEKNDDYEGVVSDLAVLREENVDNATINAVINKAWSWGMINSVQVQQLRGAYVGSGR